MKKSDFNSPKTEGFVAVGPAKIIGKSGLERVVGCLDESPDGVLGYDHVLVRRQGFSPPHRAVLISR